MSDCQIRVCYHLEGFSFACSFPLSSIIIFFLCCSTLAGSTFFVSSLTSERRRAKKNDFNVAITENYCFRGQASFFVLCNYDKSVLESRRCGLFELIEMLLGIEIYDFEWLLFADVQKHRFC